MTNELQVYIDGEFYPKSQAKISVYDHGFLYGDGVFEGIREYNGIVFKLKEHIDRLYRSAHAIMLQIPLTKEEMTKAVIETLRKNKMKDSYIRLIVSRGLGDLGLDPRKCPKPTSHSHNGHNKHQSRKRQRSWHYNNVQLGSQKPRGRNNTRDKITQLPQQRLGKD